MKKRNSIVFVVLPALFAVSVAQAQVGRQLAQTWDFFDTNMDDKVDTDELKKGLAAAQAGAPPATAPPAAK